VNNPADETNQPAEQPESSLQKDELAAEETELAADLPEWQPLTPELLAEEAQRGDVVIRWAVILLAFLLVCTEINQTTTLLHIKTGQYLLSHGLLPPRGDVFSSTAIDRTWINLSWLFDIDAALVYMVSGATGLTFWKALAAGITFWLITQIGRPGLSTWWGSILAALALLACFPYFTANPEMVTLFGIALLLWLLHQWSETRDEKSLWYLPLLFLFWAQLDPRMFIGLIILILFVFGQSLNRYLSHYSAQEDSQRLRMWQMLCLSLVASICHPFGWHTWLAANTQYRTIYPRLREYSQGALSAQQQLYALMHEIQWVQLDYQLLISVLLFIVCSITFVLNHKRLHLGWLFCFSGTSILAIVIRHELAAATLVACCVANLNAQQWYQINFTQIPSLKTSEIIFSRGGRALTVLVLFIIAFLGISGRLVTPAQSRIGLGWSPALSNHVAGLTTDLAESFDHRPFHFTLEQGDILIWLGQRSFVDSRVALFSGQGKNDILKKFNRIRVSLRAKNARIPGSGNAGIWQPAFDEYQITHVLPRLTAPRPDYVTYFDLLGSPDWQLTKLGIATAVFYRTDLHNDAELNQFLKEHRYRLIDQTFRRSKSADEHVPHADWARSRTSYQQLFSSPGHDVSTTVQTAHHYLRHLHEAGLGRMQLPPSHAAAYAYQAIRAANEELAINPNSLDAYLILANAYEFLDRIEQNLVDQSSGHVIARPLQSMRLYQKLCAYHQAQLLDPENVSIHQRLYELYSINQKYDLAAKHLEAFLRLTPQPETDLSDQSQSKMIVELKRNLKRLRKHVDQVEAEISKSKSRSVKTTDLVQFAIQQGCPSLALQELEAGSLEIEQNLNLKAITIMLLLDTGRVEQAYQLGEQLTAIVAQMGGTENWRTPVALANLALADYENAMAFWQEEIEQTRTQAMLAILATVPFRSIPNRYPLSHYSRVAAYEIGDKLQIGQLLLRNAVCHLEAQQNDQATKVLESIIEQDPETILRPHVRFYLLLLTGELIDSAPPSDRIPISPDLFAPDET